ncbi:MAG TPA: hypothetical protein VM845_01190 [Burkholderiaceae bacterium]|jgi:hypothetical protein|nr:hypothetical protein [Burkholderiaceae bacterium]
MTYFYWTMAGLTVASFLPCLLYIVLYAVTGEEACARRAKLFWNSAKVFGLLGFNVGVWGHVVVALWNTL